MNDSASSQSPTALYPPTVTGPDAPLPLWRFLPTFVRNPLRAIPTSVFHEPIVVPSPMRGRMAWITDPALIEEVLLGKHEDFPKSPIEKRIFEAIIGDGILTSEGPAWRWQRRIAAPLFRHGELMSLVPQMAAAGERMVDRWRKESGNLTEPFDQKQSTQNANHPDHDRRDVTARLDERWLRWKPGVRAIDHDMTDVTFDLLQSTIFAGATDEEAHVMKEAIGRYLDWTSWDIAYEVLRFPNWVWHPGQRPMRHAAIALSDTMLGIVARERAKGWPGGGLMAQLGNARDPDTGEPMSDPQLAHNLLTFAAAGHETTAKALTWALYLLARAPEWQQRLHDEALSVVGAATVGREHVDRLVLARQVIKEAMRLYPPAPVMGRMSRADVTLGGHRFAKGSIIIIPIYVVHRHRKLWEDPDRFDPTRFEPARESLHARTQFMPFGFGPRTCIGMSFAMIEAVVLLATFMRDARVMWDGVHAPEPVSRVTLRANGGMPLAVEMITR